MTIFQLECYYALAKSLNFTQTANQQFITQPALSRSISSLEKELGVKLVNRSTHKVSLTPAGEVFAEECAQIISAYQQGVQKTMLATENLIGTIRLGVPNDSFEPLAVKLVRALSERHSGIHIDLKFRTPTNLVRSLDDGQVDLIIASGKPRSFDCESLLIEQRTDYAVLPPNHPLADHEEISVNELRDENFIVMSRESSIAGFDSIVALTSDAGFSPKIISQAGTVSSLLMQVACGVGISILYKEHHRIAGDDVVFVPLSDERYFNRYLIWKKAENHCQDAVVALAREIFQTDLLTDE